MAGRTGNKQVNHTKKGQKKASANRKSSSGRQRNMPEEESGILFRDEVILLVFLAVSLILLLGNFGLAGGADTGGNWLSSRMRGLLGIMEYIFPFVFFSTACFCVLNKGKTQAYIKTGVVYLMLLDLAAIVQMLRGNQFEDLFEQGMNHVFSGGILGGSIARLLYSFLGFLGTIVVLIIIFAGCIVYLTELSFVKGVGQGGKKVAENTRELEEKRLRYQKEMKERRIRRQQEQEKLEEERRILQKQEEERQAQEEEARRIRKKKIAKQIAYMEQDQKEREARAKQYEPKEYVNANGMSIVTLEQPSKPSRKMEESTNDVHEIFSDPADGKYIPREGMRAASFTIQRGGEVSQVEVEGSSPPRIVKKDVQEAEHRQEENVPQESHRDMPKKSLQKASEAVEPDEAMGAVKDSPSASYKKPDIGLLKKSKKSEMESEKSLTNTGIKLQNTLQSFGVRVTVTNISCGPSVTRYELQPEQGVKVSRIVGLADDIKLNLAVEDIRIEAPIPGKAAVGIEVPNRNPSAVLLGDLLDTKEFQESSSLLSFAVGKDIGGNVVVHDVAKMPHVLIAGATGAGKSVCINTLIMSILYKADPDKVKLIMIDPKVVELSVYNGIPHMFIPVVTDPKKAAGALNWAVMEMTERYQKMADMGVRDIKGYNAKLEQIPDSEEKPPFLPQIVIIVDELADLMMVSKNEVEDAICRLAQLARAAGIHLVIATQRPSVDVITGLIKANMPSRIALAVSSGVDSRTIIDINGAEKLLGKGDMLFYPSGYPKPVRVQGAYISDDEVSRVVDYLKEQHPEVTYDQEAQERMSQMQKVTVESSQDSSGSSLYDDYFVEAGKFVIEKDKGSIGMLQRMFRIGFNRAARIMDQLEEAGVVGAEEGTKARKVLMSLEEFEHFVEESV